VYNTSKEFFLDLRNCFKMLSTATKEEDYDVYSKWNTIKDIYYETAKHVVGYRQNKIKEWLTPGTCQKINERKQLKNKLLNTKSLRLQDQIQKAYKNKDKEVKRSARSDKRSYIEELAVEAEQVAVRGEMGILFIDFCVAKVKETTNICQANVNKERFSDKTVTFVCEISRFERYANLNVMNRYM